MSIIQINEDAITRLDVSTYGELIQINSRLSKCRLRIFYKGLNRNRTFISDDFAEQLINSLPYAPIKGIFDFAHVDYEGHGEENSDGRIYGIVPEKTNFAWEEHQDADGVTRNYACCDVILYTALYPEANLIAGKSQSMEIYSNTMTGEWKTWEDGKPYFHFYTGELLGLQVLGNNVEPCFEGSAFFSLYKDMTEMANYIKKYSKQEEKKTMVIDKSMFRLSDNAKFDMLWDALNPNFTEEGNYEIDTHIVDIYDDYALCYSCKKKKYERVYYTKDNETNSVAVGDRVDVYIVDVTATEYAALEAMKSMSGSFEKVQEEFTAATEAKAALETEKTELTAKFTELETKVSGLEAEKATFSETLTAKDTEIETAKKENAEYAVKIGELTSEKVRLESENANIINEKAALAEFKKTIETEKKTAMLAEFSAQFSNEQVEAFKQKMDDMSVEQFKGELCVAAYDSDPTMFSNKQGLIHKPNEGARPENGAIGLMEKYYNGGNK